MTSDAQRNNGYEIPDPIDGYTEFVCYQVMVPNVREYRAAFMGQMRDLEKWWTWDKDGDKVAQRAVKAARYWMQLLEDLEQDNCDMTGLQDIRQKPDAPCIIQKTFDSSTWIDTVNMQLCPPKIRVNNGIVEYWDGTGWTPTEDGDERTSGSYDPPWPTVPSGQSAACLSAANMTAIYQTALTQVRAGVDTAMIAASISAGLTGIISPFIAGAIFATISLAICSAALALGSAGLDDMLQTDHLDNFQCTLYCNLASDGTFDAAGFNAARAGMAEWAGSIELEIIQLYMDGLGSVGLNRQGSAAGIVSADCSDCDCNVDAFYNWHIWGTGVDDNESQFSTSLAGFGYTDGNGTQVGDTEFAAGIGYIFSEPSQEYYSLAIGSNVTADTWDNYGNEMRVYAKRDFVGDDPNGNYARAIYFASDNSWHGSFVSPSGSVPSDDTEFVLDVIDMTASTNMKGYAYWIHSRSPYRITRIEVDGNPAP